MKKLWHVWAAFAFCLTVGLAGMVWLTVRAIDLDRAEAAARREAARARRQNELQERIAMALWRMDWMLTPLIAQEATRPSFVYRSFFQSAAAKGGKSPSSSVASPLLTQPPSHVALNFEVSPRTGWTSPQTPRESDVPEAVAAGVSPDMIAGSRRKLQELEQSVSFDELLALLPDTLLPSVSQHGGDNGLAGMTDNLAVLNDFGQRADWQQDPSDELHAGPTQQAALPRQQGRNPRSGSEAQTRQQQSIALRGDTSGQSEMSQAPTREQQEWLRRNMGMQNVARSQRDQMISNSLLMPDVQAEREGASRPVWIGSKLILARRVVSGSDVRIQGCWLDWPRIKSQLQQEVSDLFADIQLRPVAGAEDVPPGRLLATLPVQLVVPEPAASVSFESNAGTARLSAIHISLVIAWCCLLLGSAAIAIMLHGVLALSERRASFVSAVTHELRSPLTTFRMYAEMLAEGMVRDEEQRGRYLATLRQEADRLSHLVENVLQYARLERGGKARRRMEITLSELVRETAGRLPERARQAGMEVDVTQPPDNLDRPIRTDPAAVEQILFNLVDNSCKYASHGQDRRIHVQWSLGPRTVRVRVSDHGPGIGSDQVRKMFQPFSKSDREAAQSAPGIGLGLALCRRLAGEIGGKLHFEPRDREGAAFLLELPLSNRRGRS